MGIGPIVKIEDVPVEDILDTYRKGYISASQKNDILRRKAENEVKKIIGDEGVLNAVWKQTITQIQENWDLIVQNAGREDQPGMTDDMMAAAKIVWGQIGILTSMSSAIGKVTGAKAELAALRAGASPGLAKVIGVAADVGTDVIPVGMTVRSVVKGIQPIAKKVLGKTAKEAAVEGGEQAVKQIDTVVKKAITEGLKAEGVKIATEGGEAATDLKPIAEAITALSPQEKFQKALVKYRNEMKQLTETKAHAVTLAEADKLGIHLDDVRALVPGKSLNEAEMAAHLKALDEPVNELIDLAKRGMTGDDGALNAMGDMLANEFFEYSPKFRAAEITAGRSVEILKETPPMKALTDLMAGWTPEQLAKGDFKGALQIIAEDIAELSAEKLKALQIAGAGQAVKQGATFFEKMREGYVNLLLARPITQVRNFLGNMFAAGNSVVERELGGWLSIDKKAGLIRGEGLAEARGMIAGIGDGIKDMVKAFKEVSPDEATRLDFIPHKIGGTTGRIINAPVDVMRGMDAFFKAILTRGDLYAQAINLGTHSKRKLSGQALADYVARRTNMPTQAMLEHAKDFALSGTFQNDLGTIGKATQRIAQAGPLSLWFPFMKTPMNLAKYTWNRTPGLQLLSRSLYDDIAEGGTRADMAIGRLTLSNLMGMFFYGLAQQGLITGGGPADPTLRSSWLATHQPYSIMGKEGWHPITNLEPGTTLPAIMADFAEVHNQLDAPSAGQAAMALTLAGVRDIADKTYWQTVGDIVDFLGAARVGQEPSKRALSILASPVTSTTTGGPIGAAAARIVDPVRRETRSLMDDWRARVPGFSSSLPPMRDMFGDPILPPQSIGHPWLGMVLPITSKEFETDPVKQEAARLEIRAPKFPWSLGAGRVQDDFDLRASQPSDMIPVELSPAQRDRWQAIYKNILRHDEHGIEPRLLNSEAYKTATYAMKREMYMNYLAEARATAKEALMIEDAELGKSVIGNQARRYLPLLQPEKRPAAEQQIQRNLDIFENRAPEVRDNLMRWGVLGEQEQVYEDEY